MKTMKNENKNSNKNGKFDSNNRKIIGHQITYVVNTIRESMDK